MQLYMLLCDNALHTFASFFSHFLQTIDYHSLGYFDALCTRKFRSSDLWDMRMRSEVIESVQK